MNHNEEIPDFLGDLGDMLPADVLKKVNELLEQLTATYDDAERDYMAYSCVLTFAYADTNTLRIQGYYVKDPDGWTNYQRGEAEPSF